MSDEAGAEEGRRLPGDAHDEGDEDEGEGGDRGAPGGRRIRQGVERRAVVVDGHAGEGRSDKDVGPCEWAAAAEAVGHCPRQEDRHCWTLLQPRSAVVVVAAAAEAAVAPPESP